MTNNCADCGRRLNPANDGDSHVCCDCWADRHVGEGR